MHDHINRAEQKALYDRYRELAIDAFELSSLQIPRDASVHMTEDGAFVDAIVWVPKASISRRGDPDA